jgi:poly(3-hydroxybutyrate) depolymerase
MHRFTILFLLFLFLFSCKKENDNSDNLVVTVINGVYESTLSWKAVAGYTDTLQRFNVYLGDSLIAANINTRFLKVAGLNESTEYSGKIEAFLNSEKIGSGTYNFTTNKDLPPNDFQIITTDIQNDKVGLVWEKAIDPEHRKVTYDVYLGSLLFSENLDSNKCEISGLNPLTTYFVKIIAKDEKGNTNDQGCIIKTIEPAGSHMIHTYVTVGYYKREFSIYLPQSIVIQRERPLVIYLHGANGNGWKQMQSSYFRIISDREDFLLVMPQALLGTYNGESIYQWDAHELFPWDDVAFFNKLIEYMDTNYGVDLNRVYLSGMSNGGFMTFYAAEQMQDKLAAIAPIAGLMSSNVFNGYSISHPIPLCYMHGTADSIVKMNSGITLNQVLNLWIDINGCDHAGTQEELPDINNTDNATVTLFKYNGTDPNSEIRYYRINGGGHSVPGIEPGSTFDINAYEEIWKFFKRFSK